MKHLLSKNLTKTQLGNTTIYIIVAIVVIGLLWVVIQNKDQEQSETTATTQPHSPVSADTPLAEATEVVELSDGDRYEMVASIVRQEVGNRSIKRLAYNGQIPGPLLKVAEGSTIMLILTNELDVPTTLHSHGLRLENRFDGVPDVTQAPIEIGESFTYELTFPDEGIYWYHPHIREDYTQELGLYGNFLVVSNDENHWPKVDREEFLILDDILEDGKFRNDAVTHTLMGRFGDQFLINDQRDYSLEILEGRLARLYVTNVANTRTFDIEIPGLPMKLVGGDVGRIEREVMIDNFIIAPAERYIVEVLPQKPGRYPITHRGEEIGEIVVKASDAIVSDLDPRTSFETLRTHDHGYDFVRERFQELLDQGPDKSLRLSIEMKGQMHNMMMDEMMGESDEMGSMMMGGDDEAMREHCQMMPQMAGCEKYTEQGKDGAESEGMMHSVAGGHGDEGDGIEWEDEMAMMNAMSTDENITWQLVDEETGAINEDIDWSFKKGDLIKVRIENDPSTMHPMQHPIHFHGQRFVVLSRDGEPNNNLQWKDTVLIPRGGTFDLLVEMSNPGTWMAHCHIAEHLHSGMMMSFDVKD